jgi:hypothetical protein
MPSQAFAQWIGPRADRLDELVDLHIAAVGGGPGRKWGTQRFNHVLLLALMAQFQGYARDLHDEAVDTYVDATVDAHARQPIRAVMVQGRKLDVGNPRKSALGADFSVIGMTFVATMKASGTLTERRLEALDYLVDLRNAVAHGNESEVDAWRACGIELNKRAFRRYRQGLHALAGTMDSVVANHLRVLLNIPSPW